MKTLASAMARLELGVGTDLSIGVYGGVARHDAANVGFEPGKPNAAAISTIPTHQTLTGSFAVVLNFTPGISKAIGVSAWLWVYELVQNAIDAGARRMRIIEARDGLRFEHDGAESMTYL